MRTRRKALVCALVMVSLILQTGVLAYAAEIVPFNTSTSYLSAGLSISSKTATVTGSVIASKSTYSVSGTLYLQQYKNNAWVTIKTWAKETGKGSLSLSKTYTVTAGYKYRTKFVTTVNGETLTKYSSEKSA